MRSIHRKQDQGSAPAPSTQHSFCCHLIPVPHSTQVAVTVGRKWINERQAPRLRAQHCFEPDRRKKSKVFSRQSTSREVTLNSWKMYSAVTSLVPRSGVIIEEEKEKKEKKTKKKDPQNNNKTKKNPKKNNNLNSTTSSDSNEQMFTASCCTRFCVSHWRQLEQKWLICDSVKAGGIYFCSYELETDDWLYTHSWWVTGNRISSPDLLDLKSKRYQITRVTKQTTRAYIQRCTDL